MKATGRIPSSLSKSSMFLKSLSSTGKRVANHESVRTTGLYDWGQDQVSQGVRTKTWTTRR
jgi:hypothetical protein